MRRSSILGLVVAPLALCAAPAPAAAQEHAHGTERLGRVVFPVSCNAAARQGFERAMALLHSFWWEEGERAFQTVATADSTCAMAYWGLALVRWRNPIAGGPGAADLRAGQEAARRAAALGGPTPRERDFIEAVGELYGDTATVPNIARLRRYTGAMERVYTRNPTDPEAGIFFAIALTASAPAGDTTFAQQRRAAAILNPLFRQHPDHPGLAHYLIHSNDTPQLAELGLEAARRYAEIAPTAPHAQHMPSHIFVRLGLWDETVRSNRASYRAVAAAAGGGRSLTADQLHAMDYMVYAYLQRGQDTAAAAVVAEAQADTAAAPAQALVAAYNRNAMVARLALERGRWAEAARLTVRPSPGTPAAEMVTRFARGVGAVRAGDTAQARAEIAALAAIEAELVRRGDPYWPRVTRVKQQALTAWLALAAGDTAGATAGARIAADSEDVVGKHAVTPGEVVPARELEADLLLALGRPAEARRAYEHVLTLEPHRARSVFGAARAAELAGDRTAALAAYRDFLKLVEQADGERPEFTAARAFVAQASR
jgi:tetratricopeptide (TPR) repeat protein